jgi:hypothetical protein
MKKHVKVYFDHYGYGEQDFIPCFCGIRAVDIHHLTRRSAGGKDVIETLIALCRAHHLQAHADKKFNEQLIAWRKLPEIRL